MSNSQTQNNQTTTKAKLWPFPIGGATTSPITAVQAVVKKTVKKRAPPNHRASWDAVADNQLIMGYVSGQTPAALAKLCGRTKASVAGRLHSLGFLVFDKDTLTYSTAPKRWFQVPKP